MVVEHAPEPMVVEHATEGRTLRKRKEKGPKHLKRGATEKEMDNFTKKEPKETEKDIEGMFHQVRENMRQRITLKKKSDPGKFVVPCLIGGIDYTSVFCDTDSSVSILPKVMADHIGLEIMPPKDSFTFVDCSKRNSGGIIKNFEVAFMATVGAVCNMQTNKLCLTVIDSNVYYDPARIVKPQTSYMEIGDYPGFIAVCYSQSGAEVESDNGASIDTQHEPSLDGRFKATIDKALEAPIDNDPANEIDDFPKRSINSWENDNY
ncbi:hypothetical protein F2Q70_00029635 [Brassica cretica]|uniref:Uncharacterized protein n=1 Tax=Brassica cretica TaxID=69181 RepID=A0A3N6R122_BRACR|nr:hypothetical protein F2Q70_00029635 [Brassica cretica]KAF3594732.1 hypothetical protein DY000_02021467 [Brassica cretica]